MAVNGHTTPPMPLRRPGRRDSHREQWSHAPQLAAVEEVVVTSEPRPAAPQATHVAIDTADEQRAVLTFSGVLDSHALRELEERLLDPRLRQADTWVWEMRAVERIDLACAYAVLRAATTLPAGTSITIRGAGRDIQRTLHHAGVDAIATIEE